MLGKLLIFLTAYAWLIWPVGLAGDVVLSKRRIQRTTLHRSRWAFRVLHSLTLAAVVMCRGLEFFWLSVVRVHYHGGWEGLVVGPLVLYVSLRLAQRLDA